MTEQNAATAAAVAEQIAADAIMEAERLAAAAVAARELAAAEAEVAPDPEPEAPKKAPRRRKALTDIEVAAWLDEFQERGVEDQQASAVWEALSGFPQWMGAQYHGDEGQGQVPIDPRLTGEHLRKEIERRGETLPVVQKPSGTNAITTGSTTPNPWAEHMPPTEAGQLFMGVDTNIKPPFSGTWTRKTGGWLREG